MTDTPTPTKVTLGLTADDMDDNIVGRALYAGKCRVTMQSLLTDCNISLSLTTATARLGRARREYKVPLSAAECIYINVNNSRDAVATYYLDGKHAGTMFPARDWDSGAITADPGRYWVAQKVLQIAAGMAPLESARYRVAMGTYCIRCGKPLDEEESIAYGMGPKCKEFTLKEYGRRHQRRAALPSVVATPVVAPVEPGPDERAVQESLFVVKPGESLADVYARLSS